MGWSDLTVGAHPLGHWLHPHGQCEALPLLGDIAFDTSGKVLCHSVWQGLVHNTVFLVRTGHGLGVIQ